MSTFLETRLRDAKLWESPDDAMVTTQEAASMLCRSRRTLEGWRLRGKGPAYCCGTPVTYSVGELRRYKTGQLTQPIQKFE